MTAEEIKIRLEEIRPPDWGKRVFVDWYGVDLWGSAEDLSMYADTWALSQLGIRDFRRDNHANRIAFEQYLQSERLLPLAFLADKLAIPRERMLPLLDGMVRCRYLRPSPEWNQGVVGAKLADDLPTALPSFPNKIYANVPSRVKAFHVALRKDLDFEFIAVTVKTSDDRDTLSYQRDILTQEPLALGDSVWLDLKKPLSLRPDVCAKRTYFDHRDVLREFVMGSEPKMPDSQDVSVVAEPSGDYHA